jgi:hypothetical protein
MTNNNPKKKVRPSWVPPIFEDGASGPRIISDVDNPDAEVFDAYNELMDKGVEVLDSCMTPIPRCVEIEDMDPSWIVLDEADSANDDLDDDVVIVTIDDGECNPEEINVRETLEKARITNIHELTGQVFIGDDENQVLEALHKLLSETKENVNGECEPAFLHAFANGTDAQRIPAADGLKLVGGKKTVEKLQNLINAKPELRPEALEIIDHIKSRNRKSELPFTASRPSQVPRTNKKRART